MALTIDRIIELYEATRTLPQPGHGVSETHHALQCGCMAERDGACVPLVVAALLHGLEAVLPAQAQCHGMEDPAPAAQASSFLKETFGPEVSEPVRLLAPARRFLAAREPGYLDALAPAEREALRLRGGPMSPSEADSFLREACATQALQVRRWVDRAYSPTRVVPGWWYFRPRLIELASWQAELLAA